MRAADMKGLTMVVVNAGVKKPSWRTSDRLACRIVREITESAPCRAIVAPKYSTMLRVEIMRSGWIVEPIAPTEERAGLVCVVADDVPAGVLGAKQRPATVALLLTKEMVRDCQTVETVAQWDDELEIERYEREQAAARRQSALARAGEHAKALTEAIGIDGIRAVGGQSRYNSDVVEVTITLTLAQAEALAARFERANDPGRIGRAVAAFEASRGERCDSIHIQAALAAADRGDR